MNYLVTGGTGFVGTHLCNRLSANEENLVVCVDKITNGSRKFKNVSVCNADITNPVELEEVFNRFSIDTIIHLAAQVRIDIAKANPVETMRVNLGGTHSLLEIARQRNIGHFIFASSAEVYGAAQYLPIDEDHPLGTTSIYGASKIAGDRLCHAYAETYGMNICIVRPFNIYGEGQRGGVIPIFVEKALKGEPITIHGDGSQVRDYVHVKDVARAYEMIAQEKCGGVVNIGTGVGTSVKTIAENVIAISNSDSKVVFAGEPDGKTSELVADTTTAKCIGWESDIPLWTGLFRYIDWFKEMS